MRDACAPSLRIGYGRMEGSGVAGPVAYVTIALVPAAIGAGGPRYAMPNRSQRKA